MKSIKYILSLCSLVFLLAACTDDETKEKETKKQHTGKEVVLEEKQTIMDEGLIVYRDKQNLYVSTDEEMIKVKVALGNTSDMSDEIIDYHMGDYTTGKKVKIDALGYVDKAVKELTVNKEDIEVLPHKKTENADLTVEELFSQALPFAYVGTDFKEFVYLGVGGYSYNEDDDMWTVYLNVQDDEISEFRNLEVYIKDEK